jgi:hypothetical protein
MVIGSYFTVKFPLFPSFCPAEIKEIAEIYHAAEIRRSPISFISFISAGL